MVEGRNSEQKTELDEALGLDGQGKFNADDPFIPDELREALAGQAVPSWWDDRNDGRGSVRGLMGA
jgi:hypothetical protein